MSIKKAVILAAGEGKRLRPLTYTRPKCMIYLAGKPILHHIINTAYKAGVREAYVIVKYKKESITNYFKKTETGVKLHFIEQGNRYGTGAAFLEAGDYINEPFFGIAGDVISEPSALMKLSSQHEGGISIALKRVDDPSEYGIAIVEKGYIKQFEEKPSKPKSNLANCSMYVFEPSIFKKMENIKKSRKGEYEVTDLLKNESIRAVEISEYWLDMGMPWQLFNANEFILGKMKERRGNIENSTVKGKVIMEKGSAIYDSYIEGPLYLGANSTVGPHSYIRGTTSIGNNCSIGDSTTVKNSIIFDHVNAKHLAYVGDSIIGEGCNFGAATQIANYRFDEGSIKTTIGDVVVDTKRKKLGAIIGDNTKMGVLSSVMPGKSIGDNCWIGANVMVNENIERKKAVFLRQQLITEDRE
jgi:bifunctional UDP-N-acetylglucosamine pyrophosphorylase/glucosamine-1-phosphate N-acetyltransferase